MWSSRSTIQVTRGTIVSRRHYPAVARHKVHLFWWNQPNIIPFLFMYMLSLQSTLPARASHLEVAALLWGVPTRLPWPASPSLLRSPSRRLWLHPQRACCSGASPGEEIGALQFHWTKKERQRCINTDPTNRYCAIMENQDLGAKLSPTLWYEYWKKIKPCRKRTARPG